MREMKAWQARCTICQKTSDITFSSYHPGMPEGWGYRVLSGYGMCGGTVRNELCPEHYAKYCEREGIEAE